MHSPMNRNRLWSYKWEAVFHKVQSNAGVEDDSQQTSTTNSSDSLTVELGLCMSALITCIAQSV